MANMVDWGEEEGWWMRRRIGGYEGGLGRRRGLVADDDWWLRRRTGTMKED